jgi:predicted transcriptional regulator
LTNKGKAAGVLMDIDEYERLLEQAEFRKALRASLSQADRGEVISHEQALKESKRWIKKTTRFK